MIAEILVGGYAESDSRERIESIGEGEVIGYVEIYVGRGDIMGGGKIMVEVSKGEIKMVDKVV